MVRNEAWSDVVFLTFMFIKIFYDFFMTKKIGPLSESDFYFNEKLIISVRR